MEPQNQNQLSIYAIILSLIALVISGVALLGDLRTQESSITAVQAIDNARVEEDRSSLLGLTVDLLRETRAFDAQIESLGADHVVVRANVYDSTAVPPTIDTTGTTTPDIFGLIEELTTEVELRVLISENTRFPLGELENFIVGDSIRFVTSDPVDAQTTQVSAQYIYPVIPGIN